MMGMDISFIGAVWLQCKPHPRLRPVSHECITGGPAVGIGDAVSSGHPGKDYMAALVTTRGARPEITVWCCLNPRVSVDAPLPTGTSA